ncbi:MAG: D-alanyl-D-alanine carboxypeptidase family protein [Candidatus Komeilibacteria bacterium]
MFWHFVLNLALLWQVATVPTVLPWHGPVLQPEGNIVSWPEQRVAGHEAPYKLDNDSLGVDIKADSAAVMDWDSGVLLWQKQIQVIRPIASLTKLMTALVWLDQQTDPEKVMRISTDDYRTGGRYYIFTGEEIKTRDLFYATLVASDNTAAITLARSTGLDMEQFVAAMNTKAKAIGMHDTHFVEPTGLDNNNVSTAADMLKLARQAFADPDIVNASSRSDYSYTIQNTSRKVYVISTDNLLDSYLDIIAGKTGYLDEAGGCLVTVAKNEGGHKIIAIALGSSDQYSRFSDIKAMLQWTWDNYAWPIN